MAQGERRQQIRYPLQTEVEVLTSLERVNADTVDLSTDGIRVVSPRPIPPGTMVTVQFSIEGEAYLRGQVVWVLETARVGLPAYQMGIGMESIVLGDRSGVGQAETLDLIQTIIETLQAQDSHS
jgi:PilZ domain